MKGCRLLTDDEVKRVRQSFHGRYAKRNEALVVLGVACGFRISELLSLRVGDVLQHGRIVDRVTVARRFMKGGKTQTPKPRPADHSEGCRCTTCCPPPKAPRAEGRTVRLPPQARAALSVWLDGLAKHLGRAAAKELETTCPVFCSHVH
jgi:integrase